MLERCHAEAMDHARRLCWIIQRDHGVVITAVRLGEVLRGYVRGEWSDMPRTNAEDVLHGGHGRRSVGDMHIGDAIQWHTETMCSTSREVNAVAVAPISDGHCQAAAAM